MNSAMTWFKRITLFSLTNIAVIFVLTIILRLTGLEQYLYNEFGMPIGFWLIIAVVLGFGGSFISLLLSKTLAIRSTGAHVIDQPRNEVERWLLGSVAAMARKANIATPDVAIYESPDMNAFATGASRNKSLVAVSTGLLQRMGRDEVEAVLGHEVAHVANGDMITMSLLQGVLNTFVIFFSRVIGFIVDKVVFKNERGFGIGYFITVIFAQIVLGILATIIVSAFSRWREYRADAGGAAYKSRGAMIGALEQLKAAHEPHDLPEQLKAFGINGGIGGGIKRLFASHPPIDERIAALQNPTR
jgi:heat shock protein HtpX